MAKASTEDILTRLNSVEGYHPFDASTFADWSLEAGDIIKVSRDGKEYTAPVHAATLTWQGQPKVNVSSGGNMIRDPVAVMSAKEFSQSARSGNSYRSSVYRGRVSDTLESHIQESEYRVLSSVDNLDKKLGTRIDQTDTSVSMSVGRLKYSMVEKYANKDKFPPTGNKDTLYVAKDTGLSYVWVNPPGIYYLATVTDDGEVNYVKVGEIAISFNEQKGRTEAKLDADVIYAGKNAQGKLVSLADLELPDWMGATDSGIIALNANVGQLNARLVQAERITAKAITTDNFSALKTLVAQGTFTTIDTETLYIRPVAGMGKLNVANGFNSASIRLNGNEYTLTLGRFNGQTQQINFSRATSLSGAWSSSSRRFTVTASPQGNTIYTTLAGGVYDIDFGTGYTGSGTLKATIGTNTTQYNIGTVSVNAYQAYQNGASSVTPDRKTQNNPMTCTKATPQGSGQTNYTFESTLPSGRFSVGNEYDFWRIP